MILNILLNVTELSFHAGPQCTLYMSTLYIVYTVQCTLYNVHCTMYTVQCTLYNVHCTMYTVQCTLYNVHCTMYTIHVYVIYIVQDMSELESEKYLRYKSHKYSRFW